MKKTTFIFVFLFSFSALFYSCGSSDNTENDEVEQETIEREFEIKKIG